MFKFFTWWNGISPGGWFDIRRRSRHIGTDAYGNRYFEDRKPSLDGRKRRYVMYTGLAEPSKIPSEWHGWLHYTFDAPPDKATFRRHAWEIDHRPNMTGTAFASRPKGSLRECGVRVKTDSDYEAWKPDA